MPKEHKRIKPVIEEVIEASPVDLPETTEVVKNAEVVVEEPTKAQEQVEKVDDAISKKEVKKMNLKLIIVITLVSALVAAFVSGGVYVYLSGVENVAKAPEEKAENSEPAPTSEPSPSPTPEPVDLSTYSVQVLNGSGAIGVASAAEDVLVTAGFKVEDTGNAGRYDFQNTLVQAKSGVSGEAISQLKKALEAKDYKVEVGDTLSSSSEFDIVVTVGKN